MTRGIDNQGVGQGLVSPRDGGLGCCAVSDSLPDELHPAIIYKRVDIGGAIYAAIIAGTTSFRPDAPDIIVIDNTMNNFKGCGLKRPTAFQFNRRGVYVLPLTTEFFPLNYTTQRPSFAGSVGNIRGSEEGIDPFWLKAAPLRIGRAEVDALARVDIDAALAVVNSTKK